jgi:hypothetical protein
MQASVSGAHKKSTDFSALFSFLTVQIIIAKARWRRFVPVRNGFHRSQD